MYHDFATEYGWTPEQVREMPVYDVYMLRYASVVKYINRRENSKPKAESHGVDELNRMMRR